MLEETIKNIAQICGLEEIPHCDTINDVFENIKPEEIEKIRKYMINKLLRNKMLEKYKIRNKYYHVVFDGTGLATRRKKYNKNCIGSEFVENEDENLGKQDCEIQTFKRFAQKIKKEYPRLKIILGADALYAKKTIIDICKENGWKYIIRFKEGTIPRLYEEFKTIVKTEN